MPDAHEVVGVEPVAIGRWFAAISVEHTAPLRLDRIGLGQSNLTYLVRDDADRRWTAAQGAAETPARFRARCGARGQDHGALESTDVAAAAAGTPTVERIEAIVHKALDVTEHIQTGADMTRTVIETVAGQVIFVADGPED